MVKNLKRTLALMLALIMICSSTFTVLAENGGSAAGSEAESSVQTEETVVAGEETATEGEKTEAVTEDTTQETQSEAATQATTEAVVPVKSEITSQPEDASVLKNAEAVFSVETEGTVKSCQWQMAKNKKSAWSNLNRRQYGSSETLKIRAVKKYDNRYFRCIVTFKDGTKAVSEGAALHIVEKKSYPAQNFGSVKNTKVVAPEGAFPAGTTMEAEEVEDTAAVQAILDDMDGVEGDVLTAVDISFYDGKNEIQPKEAVKVTMNVGTDVDFEDLSLVHIKANADELDKTDLETETIDFTYDEEAGTISFDADSFSTYVIRWYYNSNQTTIHHGYLDGNNFVEFTAQPAPVNVNTSYRHYLIYDFDGYEYSGYTYYRTSASTTPTTGSTRIQAQLRYSSSNWRYHGYSTSNDNRNWNAIADNSHIYVVYKAKTAPTTGGTPVMEELDPSDWPQDPQTPQFSKTSIHNSDGVTNTVSLSINGGEKEVKNSTKANVIVVFDRSGSMSENLNGQTRLVRAQTAVKRMANTLLNDMSGVEMALVSFSHTSDIVQGFTDTYNTFSNAVDRLSADGGTNWEQSLAIANRMAVDSDAATFIVFVTDGDPTYRVSRYNASDQEIQGYNKDGRYFEFNIFGAGDDDPNDRDFDAAVDEVKSILSNNKTFYAIGVSSDVTKVRKLVTNAGGSADNAFLATDSDKLDEAFENITQSIKTTLGFGDVKITDGITELSNVEMKVMQEVNPDSFRYYKITSAGQEEWNPASEGCGLASYNSTTGAVIWNMGEGFQLEKGVTYRVDFKVWPSQNAYNLIAELNNGTKVYAAGSENSITDEEREQIVELKAPTVNEQGEVIEQGEYTLKTNTNSVNATYSQTSSSGDTVTVSGQTGLTATYHQGTLENMPLESMKLTIKKEFEDDLTAGEDRVHEVTLVMKQRSGHQATASDEAFVDFPVPQKDGSMSPNIVLNEQNGWTYSVYVAPGLQETEDSEPLEYGYDYTVTEPDINYHYGLIEEVINPMVVNGEDRYYGDGYLIKDDAVVQDYVDRSITAVNRVKSGIDITKVVEDDEGKTIYPDEEFTITGKILDPNGNSYTFNTSWDDRVDKRPTNQGGDQGSEVWQQHQNDPIAYHMYDKDGKQTIYKGHFADTNNIEFTLKAGERIRFINVPENCTFEFDEIKTAPNMSADFQWLSSVGIAQHRDGPGGEFTQVGDKQPLVDGSKVYLPKGVEGYTGVAGNKQYAVTFTNKAIKGEWFYVYHSSDNTIEKIYTSDDRVDRVYSDGKYTYSFNIADEVKTGNGEVPTHLYGGYYEAYNGQAVKEGDDSQDKKDATIRALTYDPTTNIATDPTASSPAEVIAGYKSVATPYTGSKATAWKGSTAYTNEVTAKGGGKGTLMTPVAGTVYYLKEVPNDYFRPYIYVVYDENNNNSIISVRKITATDDKNYSTVGFYDGSAYDAGDTLSALITVTKLGTTYARLTAAGAFDGNTSYKDKPSLAVPRGFLLCKMADSFENNFNMQPYFITLDGVKVYGVTKRTVKPGNKTYVHTGSNDNMIGELPGITVDDVTNVLSIE